MMKRDPNDLLRISQAVAEATPMSSYPRRPFVCSSGKSAFCPPLEPGEDETCTHTPTCPTGSTVQEPEHPDGSADRG